MSIDTIIILPKYVSTGINYSVDQLLFSISLILFGNFVPPSIPSGRRNFFKIQDRLLLQLKVGQQISLKANKSSIDHMITTCLIFQEDRDGNLCS